MLHFCQVVEKRKVADKITEEIISEWFDKVNDLIFERLKTVEVCKCIAVCKNGTENQYKWEEQKQKKNNQSNY